MVNKRFLIAAILIIWCAVSLPPPDIAGAQERKTRLGLWVTVFSPDEILKSRENADRFISTCKKIGIDHAYVQIYRAGKAYYNPGAGKKDVFKYLVSQAHKNDLKIYAWINLLSIAQNKKAFILKKLGDRVLVKDQLGRTPLREGGKDELDKYYIRENQLFLEPGSPRVRKYLAGVAETIVKSYPELDGLHLDYVRYPYAVPFAPGSRFTPPGINYGCEEANAEKFKKATGLNIKTMDPARENFRKWDDWRRDQVTSLVRDISARVRTLSPSAKISCAVLPTIERAYLASFQDWTNWLKENYIDWVVAMDYTEDTHLMKLNAQSVLFPQFEGRIYIGIGAFLLKDKPEIIEEQIGYLREIAPGGIVIFSYDDVKDLPLSEAGS